WHDGTLEPLEYCDLTESALVAADSWLVAGGSALALSEHRARFLAAADGELAQLERFWDAAIARIPREGLWFPRVESHENGRLVLRLRPAPPLARSVVLATWDGSDPRTMPSVKGPDIATLVAVRTRAQAV